MMGLADPKLLDEFEQAEIDDPTPSKEVDGRTIYLISASILATIGRTSHCSPRFPWQILLLYHEV